MTWNPFTKKGHSGKRESALPKGLYFEPEPGIPEANPGAPCPMLVAGEHSLVVAYYANRPMPEFDGTNPKQVSEHTDDEPCVALVFDDAYDFRFGPPDEEGWGAIWQLFPHIETWRPHVTNIRKWVSEMTVADNAFEKVKWEDQKHYVLPFHDSTIEVIATGYRVEEDVCSVHEMIARQHARAD